MDNELLVDDFSYVHTIAHKIALYDFRVWISGYVSSTSMCNWIITVGEINWCRHLKIETSVVLEDPIIHILSNSENSKPVDKIDMFKETDIVKLSVLLKNGFRGIKKRLYCEDKLNVR